MALLAVNCFASSNILLQQALPAEAAHISATHPVRCLPVSALRIPTRRVHNGLVCGVPMSRIAVAFEHPSSRSFRRRTLRRRGISMALNDNQGSSGEDMLHADDDFREAAVIDARVFIDLKANLRCAKQARGARAGRIFYHAAVPTIFLKMEASDLVLPIVVNGQASQMLTQALKKETGARPTMYEVIREMCAATKMEVKMVRVTGRVVDTYHARIYLAQANSNEIVSVDAKPSDAINIAVACNVKIFVNKNLMESDGVIPEYKTVWTDLAGHGFARLLPDARLDVADNQHDPLAEEIILIKNMSNAASEERYADAARWRDELQKFRTKNKSRRLHRQV